MTHVFRNGQTPLNLLGFLNLSNTRDLVFGIISPKGKLEKLSIDNDLHENILYFLRQTDSDASKTQDCLQFVKWYIGEGSIPDDEISLKGYFDCDIKDIQPNGFILLRSDSGHHGAVYLGEGIYLSRFGAGAPLGGASLEQLIQIYNPTEIIAWNKKDPSD